MLAAGLYIVDSQWFWTKLPSTPEVRAFIVKNKKIQSFVESTGTVTSDENVKLSFAVPGVVFDVLEIGSRVTKGTTIAVLDKRESEANLRRTEASLANVKAKTAIARREYRNAQTLHDVGAISTNELQEVSDKLSAVSVEFDLLTEELNLAEIAESKSELIAPFDGVITDRTFEKGQFVSPGTGSVNISSVDRWKVVTSIDASESALVQVGQFASISFVDFPAREWDGQVTFVAPTIEKNNNSSVFDVWIVAVGVQPQTRIGQQVDIQILLESVENTIVVPFSALREESDVKTVAKVVDGRVRIQRVTTGLEDLTETEITGGLSLGDVVIVDRSVSLADGDRVQWTEQ